MYEKLKNKHILYLEDDEVISNLFVGIFNKLQIDIDHAPSFEKAAELFENHKYNAVISDLRLPDKNGMEFIKLIREKDKKLPIIITSGFTDTDYLIDAIEFDVSKYFVKPFSEIELINHLETLMTHALTVKKSNYVKFESGLKYNYDTKQFYDKEGIEIKLSLQESILIELLLKNKNRVVKYDEITSTISKHHDKKVSIDTLRTVVKNIRKKTTDDIIITRSGLGYQINAK